MPSFGVALLLCCCSWVAQAQVVYDPAGMPPLRRTLPSGLDYLESGFYWMQDWWGVGNFQDPARLLSEMEDQLAESFDLDYIAYQIGGPRYTALNILKRSHFQHRVRDRLFEEMALRMGWLGDRMPRVYPLMPIRKGPYQVRVGAVFQHYGGPRLLLQFQLNFSYRGWRIYDVSSNGESLVSKIRQDFLAGDL